MATKRVLGVSVVVLIMVSFAQGQSWQGQRQGLQPGMVLPPQAPPAADQSYGTIPPGYGSPPPPPSAVLQQSIPPDNPTGRDAQPLYQYPPYRNPYYNGVSAGEFLSGTVDWLFSLPSGLIDRFTSFMDGNFFPQSPATHGAPTQSEVQGARPLQDNQGSGQALPPAAPYQPVSR
jgi:hypothetical protein